MESEQRERSIHAVIGCMIEVHKTLGPGFLEGMYRRALEIEFAHANIKYESEKQIEVEYRGRPIGTHRLDFFIEDELVLELKEVDAINKKHYAQVRSYLKAVNKPVGLLANFSEFQLDHRRVELER